MNTETPLAGPPDSQDKNLPTGHRLLPCVAFFITVLVSLVAAAVVSEAPMIVVGLY